MPDVNLFLDDYRWPEQVKWVNLPDVKWTRMPSSHDFKAQIEESDELPIMISFDHDLEEFDNGRETTGFDCLQWLVLFCRMQRKPLPVCHFHSFDAAKRKDMREFYELSKLRERKWLDEADK
jgi:hypothetical protein